MEQNDFHKKKLHLIFLFYLVNNRSLGMASKTINVTKWLSYKKKNPTSCLFFFLNCRSSNDVLFALILFIYYYLLNNKSLIIIDNLLHTRLLPRTLPPLW
jgi:hypothetical protein